MPIGSLVARVVSSTIAGIEEGAVLHIAIDKVPRVEPERQREFLPYESIPLIKELAASAFGTTAKKMERRHRTKMANVARNVAIYLSCDLTQTSLPQIAHHFGKRHHRSIMYVRDQVKDEMRWNEFYRNKVLTLVGSIVDVAKKRYEGTQKLRQSTKP
jgi:chromosomal replication initiation ATPase DnaA